MKKTTKMAAVLAAMSVMAIGAVSTTMAATEGWNGNDNDGWTYVQDGVKIKGWQQINGVWYYFQKDGKMAQDELVTISGETYYLSQTGAMATGWQKFESDHDIYDDLEDEFPENSEANDNNSTVIDDDYLYDDEIWLYFDSHGVGAEDKWIQSDAGLWYYFDDLIMARSDYSYRIDDNFYGLDENGAMMIGWIRINDDTSNKRPTGSDDTTTWYYYQSNGKQVIADDGGKWKKIDGNWYYFLSDSSDHVRNNGIVLEKFAEIGDDGDFFYLDSKGVMASGVTKVPDDTKISGSNFKSDAKIDDDIEVWFDSGKGKTKTGFNGNSYYCDEDGNHTLAYEKKDNLVTNAAFDAQVKGQLVKNAFVEDDGNLYYVDKYGEIIKNESLEVEIEGKVYKIVFDSKGKAIKEKDVDDKIKAGKTYTVNGETSIDIITDAQKGTIKTLTVNTVK